MMIDDKLARIRSTVNNIRRYRQFAGDSAF